MPRSPAHLEINSFVKGLVTEASPLTFPDNASLDEDNMVLNIDGSRDRRLGIDYEQDYVIKTSPQPIPATRDMKFGTFNWENVGGDAEKEFAVVQIGNRLSFFNVLDGAVSDNQVGSDFFVGDGKRAYSFANIDGVLAVANGTRFITTFSYDGTTISSTSVTLKIRDLFGVEDIIFEGDLFSPSLVTYRPPSGSTDPNAPVSPPNSITTPHLYNLRNQSWGVPRRSGSTLTAGVKDPVIIFERDFFDYPSNADAVHSGVLVDPSDNRDPPEEALFPYKLGTHPPVNAEAAKGFFVIDALDRGTSRQNAYAQQCSESVLGSSRLDIGTLPLDKTPGGSTCLAEFAGRLFYAGFSGQVEDGDNRSPNMSSYVLFSKLVKHLSDVSLCYQEGDPTDKEAPELIATDGGSIKIQGAYGIKRLVNIGNALVVLAENGAWLIKGESGVGFSATSFEVVQLTKRGCVAPSSVVVVDDSLLYWSSDGIYSIARNDIGDYTASNITHTSIRQFYEGIPPSQKDNAKGSFDSFSRRACWVYGGTLDNTEEAKVLLLDTKLGAFFPHTIKQPTGSTFPKIVAAIEVPPFKTGTSVDEVVSNGEQVQVNLDEVTVTSSVRETDLREIKYLTITGEDSSGQPQYTFSSFKDQEFLDWKSFDGTGIDAAAYLLTGYLTGGDSSRKKYVPTVYFHFKRTEDGFTVSGENIIPTKPSSCKVQAQWDWANSANSGNFGREFQAYRYKRHYMPSDVTDPYDYGFETIVTRNRLRGNGKALSLLIKTEPGKDLRLLGWGQDTLINGRA